MSLEYGEKKTIGFSTDIYTRGGIGIYIYHLVYIYQLISISTRSFLFQLSDIGKKLYRHTTDISNYYIEKLYFCSEYPRKISMWYNAGKYITRSI